VIIFVLVVAGKNNCVQTMGMRFKNMELHFVRAGHQIGLETSILSALKSFWWVGGGGCTCDYSVSLSPNLWIMTFDLDLDLDLGLTIVIQNKCLKALRHHRQLYCLSVCFNSDSIAV